MSYSLHDLDLKMIHMTIWCLLTYIIYWIPMSKGGNMPSSLASDILAYSLWNFIKGNKRNDEVKKTESNRKEVYTATAELVKQRLDKAGSRFGGR